MNNTITIWNVEEELGYKPLTTFWNDFCIAEILGETGIRNTFKSAFEDWKENIKYITELALVLNHKCWYWYEKDDDMSTLYSNLYYKLDEWASKNLKDEDAEYYYKTLD